MKTCTKCKTEKELENFYKEKRAKDGLCSQCKSCTKEQQKEYNEINKEKLSQQKKEYREKNKEEISLQRKEFRGANRERLNQKDKEYYQENKEKFKKYRKENAEQIKKYNKKYWESNREKLLEQKIEYDKEYRIKNRTRINEYRKERYKNNPQFRIAHNLRVRNNQGIVSQGGIKSDSTEKLLGCSFEEANKYIESLFTEGMTWENYGEWEIDHIRPMISFDLTDPEQQKLCCHYTNYQPLWAEVNRSKSGKWDGPMYSD